MDVLVDLSEPKVSPKKQFASTRNVQMSTKDNKSLPKLIKQSCATGILIDFSDPISQPLGETDALYRTTDQSVSSDHSKTADRSNMSESQLIYLEGTGFDISPQSIAMNGENSSYPALSSLNAHQMAELFEQANTVAVRIELANARQCTRNTSSSGASSPVCDIENNQFSPEEIIITDECLKAATSTPAQKVVPDVDAHFWGVEVEKSLCLEMDGKARVSEERPMVKKQIRPLERTISVKQRSIGDTNQGKTLIGRAPSLRIAKVGASVPTRTLVAPKTKADSLHDSRSSTGSTASSSASDSNVYLKAPKSRVNELRLRGSTQPKNDNKTSEVLTRSLGSPSVPTGRPGSRHTMGSMEIMAEKKKALLLKPSRNLPLRPPGRLDRKETGIEHGTNRPLFPAAVNKLQLKQNITRKVGNQMTTAAGKSENQSKKL